jgi:hypothetical protein
MTRTSQLTIASVFTLALLASVGSARKPWPKPTPPPPASPFYLPSKERAPSAAEIAAEAATHNQRIAFEVERALLSRNPRGREAAFTFLLPELIQIEPRLVVEMHAAQPPGEARDKLRTELARQWISRDRAAAIGWMNTLDEAERRSSAYSAVRAIAAATPGQAIAVADQFGVGHDDGYVDWLVQGWVRENPQAVTHWLATQPDGPRKRQVAALVAGLRRD